MPSGFRAYALHQFVKDDDGEPVNKYGLGVRPVRWREAKEAVRPEGAARPHLDRRGDSPSHGPLLDTFDEPAAKALKLIAYTGLRVEDASTLTMGDVDLKARTITLDRDEFKSDVKFMVPLCRWCGDVAALDQARQEG